MELKYDFDWFDTEAPINKGRPRYFNLKYYLSVVEMMINADEVTKALWLLDNPPSWFKDHEPEEMTMMRRVLHRKLFTNTDYMVKVDHAAKGKDVFDECYPRSHAVAHYVKEFNDNGVTPHIFELGPNCHWLPIGLELRGHKFTYKGVDLDRSQLETINKAPWWSEEPNHPTIFVCFEVIEHLNNPADIRHYMEQLMIEPSYIMLSTPMYCYNGGLPNWFTRDLGHLRTYTPKEFTLFATENFPKYDFEIIEHHCMVLIGKKR